MKLKTWVEAEVEADFCVDDFLAAIAELPESERLRSMLSAVNAAYSVLRRIPEASIGEMKDEQRKMIFDALNTQAGRYGVQHNA